MTKVEIRKVIKDMVKQLLSILFCTVPFWIYVGLPFIPSFFAGLYVTLGIDMFLSYKGLGKKNE